MWQYVSGLIIKYDQCNTLIFTKDHECMERKKWIKFNRYKNYILFILEIVSSNIVIMYKDPLMNTVNAAFFFCFQTFLKEEFRKQNADVSLL